MMYKVLVDGKSANGGSLTWSLPTQDESGNWTPGNWHEVQGKVIVGENGLHLTSKPVKWMKWGAEIFIAEGAGESVESGDDKIAYQRARLLSKVEAPEWWIGAQSFVRGIPMLNWLKPDGNPDPEWKLFTASSWNAARAAAWDAAGTAARAAAGDAARAAVEAAAGAAWDTAWDAARAAAWDAAWDAARAAAGAAWDAARDVPWDAAWAAGGAAAWDAAWAAAWDAAWDAAWAAGGAAAGAAWAAARDAALYVETKHIVADLPIDQKHVDHAKKRWEVWEKGYALLCDINGVLYVYAAQPTP